MDTAGMVTPEGPREPILLILIKLPFSKPSDHPGGGTFGSLVPVTKNSFPTKNCEERTQKPPPSDDLWRLETRDPKVDLWRPELSAIFGDGS